MGTLEHVAATAAGLVVGIDGAETTLSWRWVRDHGEDETSFDPETKQRRIYAISGEDPTAASAVELSQAGDVPTVAISWSASDRTWISQSTLVSVLDPRASTPGPSKIAQLWHRPAGVVVTKLDVDQILRDDAALATWVTDLAKFGFASLAGFSGGHDEVTALASRIGYPRSTLFGSTWDLASDLSDHDDTAYSQSFLAPHTDGTYSHEAPGLQMFCCLERSGTGGESVIVDAFAIAETLRQDFPEDFEVLTTVSVPGHYIEPGVELRTSRPAIRLDHQGDVVQISMNNYDRSPMYLPPAEMDAFYRAYGRLHDLANDRDRWLDVRLEPGDVLINDNWRVLHGREAYTGARLFVGCYLNHEDFESRFRTLAI